MKNDSATLTVELAEEVVALSALLEEHARDSTQLDGRTVEQVARSIRRSGLRLIEVLGKKERRG